MIIDGETTLYGVIGSPISHTLSPRIHNFCFKYFGLNSLYIPFEVHPNELKAVVKSLKTLGIKGFNITVPHKVNIVPLLDKVDTSIKFIEAVNTVVLIKGEFVGFNTDVNGFLSFLEKESIALEDTEIVILGAGGAARAILYASISKSPKTISIVNRTPKKADEIAKKIKSVKSKTSSGRGKKNLPKIEVFKSDTKTSEEAIKKSDIIINCTALGLNKNDSLPVNPQLLSKGQIVIDLIYNPSETKLLAESGKRGLTTFNGLGMLIFQAIEAFELWTEHTPLSDMLYNLLE